MPIFLLASYLRLSYGVCRSLTIFFSFIFIIFIIYLFILIFWSYLQNIHPHDAEYWQFK